MRKLLLQSIVVMENAFRRLEKQVPSPERQPFKGLFVYRYKDKTAEQAIIQKLVRYVTGLKVLDILVSTGFSQEQGVIQRTLDEIREDVLFMSGPLLGHDKTESHDRFLEAFWVEQFFEDHPEENFKKPFTVRRRNISAYVNKMLGDSSRYDQGLKVDNYISGMYSGFVHAASVQIMDCYGGLPPRFHLSGMTGTAKVDELVRDAWNYYLRGLFAFGFAAMAFGDYELNEAIRDYIRRFDVESEDLKKHRFV